MGKSLARWLLSRGEFLGLLAAGVASVVPRRAGRRVFRRDAAASAGCPRKAAGMWASRVPHGRLLVTESGQGAAAGYGCSLNPVAEWIWRLSDGTRSIDEIARGVADRFGVPYEVAWADARSFVGLMVDRGFLCVDGPAENDRGSPGKETV
jgi:hypothetical protein